MEFQDPAGGGADGPAFQQADDQTANRGTAFPRPLHPRIDRPNRLLGKTKAWMRDRDDGIGAPADGSIFPEVGTTATDVEARRSLLPATFCLPSKFWVLAQDMVISKAMTRSGTRADDQLSSYLYRNEYRVCQKIHPHPIGRSFHLMPAGSASTGNAEVKRKLRTGRTRSAHPVRPGSEPDRSARARSSPVINLAPLPYVTQAQTQLR